MDEEFKIGDYVEITNCGQAYSSYLDFMISYGTKEDCVKFNMYKSPENGFKGYIKFIGKHEVYPSKTLAIIADDTHCYIINIDGIKLVEKKFITIQEFYDYAVENGIQDLPFGVRIAKDYDDDVNLISEFSLDDIEQDGGFYEKGHRIEDNFVWVNLIDAD